MYTHAGRTLVSLSTCSPVSSFVLAVAVCSSNQDSEGGAVDMSGVHDGGHRTTGVLSWHKWDRASVEHYAWNKNILAVNICVASQTCCSLCLQKPFVEAVVDNVCYGSVLELFTAVQQYKAVVRNCLIGCFI